TCRVIRVSRLNDTRIAGPRLQTLGLRGGIGDRKESLLKIDRASEPPRGVFLERMQNDSFELGRNVGIDLSRWTRRLVNVFHQDGEQAGAGKWSRASDHL